MFEALRKQLLKWLRTPAEPDAPAGDPRSVRVFRASRKLYYLRLVRWSIGQAAALVGILFWLGVVALSEREAERVRAGQSAHQIANLPAGRNRITTEPLRWIPRGAFLVLWMAKAVAVLVYMVQLAATYVAVRLDYEMRWYIVTDRSLRIRWGLWSVNEVTMSFANLQKVVVTQGPLQRLLGIGDVRVESAGGGSEGLHREAGPSMHTGVFHGVERAPDIRDLILANLSRYRATGLGDPDERVEHGTGSQPARIAVQAREASSWLAAPDLLPAARELLKEAKGLREAAVRKSGNGTGN